MKSRLPIDQLINLTLRAIQSPITHRIYRAHLNAFAEWRGDAPLTKDAVQTYVQYLRDQGRSPAIINQALTALRKLAMEARDNGVLSPAIADGIDRAKPVKRRGRKIGHWLEPDQARTLLLAHDLDTLKGMRDRVLFGLLLECGLRREEAAAITLDQLQEREGRAVIADIVGKGGRVRTVPVPARLARHITAYIDLAAIESGRLLRPVNKADNLEAGDGITAAAIYKQVRTITTKTLGEDIRPHDLRRTFARLTRREGAEIDQLQHSLGHANICTTQIYLGDNQNLKAAPCDLLDLESEHKEEDQK